MVGRRKAIPPGGARFTAAVLTMLEREEHWIRRKKAGCASFDKAAAETRAEADGGKRRRLSGLAGCVGKKMKLGNPSLGSDAAHRCLTICMI